MNQEFKMEIEVVDLAETTTAVDVGVELSEIELHAISGGQKGTWSCGRPRQVDEWTP
jgi:hypothetical protein